MRPVINCIHDPSYKCPLSLSFVGCSQTLQTELLLLNQPRPLFVSMPPLRHSSLPANRLQLMSPGPWLCASNDILYYHEDAGAEAFLPLRQSAATLSAIW